MEEKGKKKFVTADELLVEIVMDQLDEICENHDKVGLFVDKSDFLELKNAVKKMPCFPQNTI